MTKLCIQASTAPSNPLPDMPIEPSWITEGKPIARGAMLNQSDDKKVSNGFWSCTEGKFDWTFAWDEFVTILEGQVIITEAGDGGRTYTLNVGDAAHFPLGLKSHWHVTEPVKKYFVVRTPEPLEL